MVQQLKYYYIYILSDDAKVRSYMLLEVDKRILEGGQTSI